MTVSELISKLQKLPQESTVFTNECEATSAHEAMTSDVEVGFPFWTGDNKGVFVGSSGYVFT